MRPYEALWPKIPANDAGIRIDPPPSVPMASGPSPAATAALEPPLEPPGGRSVFPGFWGAPHPGVVGGGPPRPRGRFFFLPSGIPPAAFMRATIGASSVGTLSAKKRVPKVVRTPLVMTRSLGGNGRP